MIALPYVRCLQLLLLGGLLLLAGQALPAYGLGALQLTEVELAFDQQGRPAALRGQLALSLPEPRAEVCFYLPYHADGKQYSYNPLKHFDPLTARQKTALRADGTTSFTLAQDTGASLRQRTQLTRALVRLRFAKAQDRVSLDFVSTFSSTFARGGDEYFFDGFYPMPLESCPPATLAPEELELGVLPTSLTAAIAQPAGWTIAGPGRQLPPTDDAEPEVRLATRGRWLAFAMARHYYHEALSTKAGRIDLYALEPQFFTHTRATLLAALAAHQHWLGPLPFDTLSVVESRSYQRAGLPGLIALNRPQQFLFDYVQTSMLNWQHWALSALLVAQWYGGAVTVHAKKDEWLLAGISDFINLEFLRQHHKRYNLFNSFDQDFGLLTMDYLQLQEATASLLHRAEPASFLTDPTLQSSQRFKEQNPLLFVKHALALRYLKSTMGEVSLAKFLRRFTQAQLFTTISPEQFLESLSSSAPAAAITQAANQEPNIASQHLRQWWTSLGWSNLSLVAFDKQQLGNGQWLATATYKQGGTFRLPTQVGFRTSDGLSYLVKGQPLAVAADHTEASPAVLYRAYVMTDLEPVEVTIDPQHFLFDPDRFDNSSRQPELHFFPGTASTLSDADYTAVWVPYAFRRPGQSYSLALQGALFRYLNSGLFVKIELSPHDRRGSYHLRYQHRFSQWPSLTSDASVTHTYEGARTSALTLQQAPFVSLGPYDLMLASTLRMRQQVGSPTLNHPTLAASLRLYPGASGQRCSLVISGEREEALPVAGYPYTYNRQKAEASGLCSLYKNYDLQLRLFKGQAAAYGHTRLPHAGHFRINDLSEAAVRIDEASLPLALGIESAAADLYLPLVLPLPAASLILSKQVRLRAFYDLGRAHTVVNPAATALYRAAGLGMSLPLGGDVMGVGSLTLTRFSLLAVLYTNNNGLRSQRPHFLFDLTGEL